MKKFLRKLPVWYTAFAILVCSFLAFPVGVFAADSFWADYVVFDSPYFGSVDGTGTFVESYDGNIYFGVATGPAIILANSETPVTIPVGEYVFGGNAVPDSFETDGTPIVRTIEVQSLVGDDIVSKTYAFGETVVVDDTTAFVIAQSYNVDISVELVPKKSVGLFYSAWDLLAEAIYGTDAELTAEMNLTLTFLCTLCALAIILVPFFLIYWVLRFIFRW